MSATKPTTVTLSTVRRPPDMVALVPEGRQYPLRRINGVAMQMERDATAAKDPLKFYDLAAYLLPDAPRHEIDELDEEQIAWLFQMSSQGVALVVAALEARAKEAEHPGGNAVAPPSEDTPAPAPAPGTTSPPSA